MMTHVKTDPNPTGIFRSWYIYPALLILLVIVVFKDLMHSISKDSSFYLSESMLFGVYWILFIPFIIVCASRLKSKPKILYPVVLSILHIALFSLIVFGVSSACFDHTFKFTWTFVETSFDDGLSCLLVYSSVFFITTQKWLGVTHTEQATKVNRVKVVDRGKTVLLHPDEIVYVASEKPYIAIVTTHKKYLSGSTLKRFQTEVQSSKFIQIHKGTVINPEFIESFSSRGNGDYDLVLHKKFTVRASRTYRQNFIPWLNALRSA